MNDTKERKDVLQACFGQAKNTVELVEYSDDAIVSKTLLDRNAGTITLFAFDKGQGLSEHTARFDAVVQVLDGTAAITMRVRPLRRYACRSPTTFASWRIMLSEGPSWSST